ncbi:MAG: SH3 domain-containing protein [Alphaproteobacteria bacterium]|nr:SH3 domain-containing protein [Alphaproteobacteria bacterium]MDX5370456.1 SH3 domain-containing protein [Alphaproteobacteria bacterium]MDX5464962.1 SH3 domain-containing protein [Alphaproteobacteria bacterium]
MKRILSLLAGAVLLGASATPALAQPDMRTEQVRFAPGSTAASISGRIAGRDFVVYKVGAEAGQRMQIRLTSDNLATYFNVYAPGSGPGDDALAIGDLTGPMMPDINVFDGVLPSSGTYSVSVYLYRSAARRGETSNYRLDISIEGSTGPVVRGDYADGLQGGPDFWRVRAGGGLNLRAAPSTGADVLMHLPNGLELRNLGCRMAEGRRWCQVSPPASSVTGWVAGDYLVEASGENATQLPSMAPAGRAGGSAGGNLDRPVGGVRPEGSAFTATGLTQCSLSRDAATQTCEFGVIREGNGNGTVIMFWPESGTRVIYFEDGRPVSFDRSQADSGKDMSVTREDSDTSIVFIGEERYVLPDAIIFGG